MKFIYKIVFFVILVYTNLLAQEVDPNKSVIIESLILNNQEFISTDKITITDNDALVVRYKLKSDDNKDAILFNYILISERDTVNKSTGTTQLSLGKLKEGNYHLIIGAFDLQRRWKAEPTKLFIEVDNEKAKLKADLKLLESKNQNSILKSENNKLDSNNSGNIFVSVNLPIIYLIIGIILVVGVVIFLIMKIMKSNKTSDAGKSSSSEEYENLLKENGALRAELAALRGQVDAMQVRGEELMTQNRELQSSLNKLSSSKDELEELQKQKDELFTVIIHDIKNPATLIKSLVELLTSYDLSAIEQQEVINDIAQTTSKIVSLSQEVSKILSLETNKLNLKLDTLNLNDIAQDVVYRNSIAANNKGHQISKNFAENLPNAELDQNKIDEIMDNLFSNAIKYTPNGGIISIKTYQEGDYIVCEVKDNGLGLTQEDIKYSFQRGARLSAKPTAGESSTGLGLWIVKKLVDAHNGKVWVKSALGKGSTFAFSIPIKQPTEIE